MTNLYQCVECEKGVINDDLVWRDARWLCLGCAPRPVPEPGPREFTLHLPAILAIAVDDLRKDKETKLGCVTRLILEARKRDD